MKIVDLLFQNENFVRQKGQCYGMHRGYYVTAIVMEYDIFAIVQVDELDEARRQELLPILATLQNTHKRCDIVVNAHSVQIHIRTSMGGKKEVTKIEHCVDTVINYFISAGLGSGCAHCGSHEPLQISQYGQLPELICDNCMQEVNKNIQYEASQPKVKSSLIPGIVGALLGTLVGVAAWFIIYQLGYLSSFGGLIMAVGAMWGYEKLGRALDLKGVIISSVIVLVMIYVTNRLCWAYDWMTVLKDEGYSISLGDAFKEVEDIIKQGDIMGDYIKDLVIGYVLTVIGTVSMVINKVKNR